MIKKYSTVILLVLLISSCSDSNKPEKPDNLISVNEMENILYDSYILNATKASNRKIVENNGILPQDVLFKKYNIDSAIFAQSNAYYAYDLDLYQQMINNVKNRLEKEKKGYTEELRKISESKRIKQDSIKEAKIRRKDSLKKLKAVNKIKNNS